MTKERTYKTAYADELLRIAQGDLQCAEILARGNPSRQENIFFHVGQAIEKALKAKICMLGKPVPLTHDLQVIIDRIPTSEKIPHQDEIEDLSQFATIRRYEEGEAIFEPEEIDTAIRTASEILHWVTEKRKA